MPGRVAEAAPGSQAEEPCPYASSVRSSALRGYNGSLIIGNDAVLIRRGLRGVLARKRRDPDLQIPFDEVAAVRFAPSGWLVGYLQVIESIGRCARLPHDDPRSPHRDVPHSVRTVASRRRRSRGSKRRIDRGGIRPALLGRGPRRGGAQTTPLSRVSDTGSRQGPIVSKVEQPFRGLVSRLRYAAATGTRRRSASANRRAARRRPA